MPPRAPLNPLAILDPAWLFLLAGVTLVIAAALIPAFDDLKDAQHHRDRAVAMERYRLERLATHTAFLGALETEDQTLLRSLAATQLNRVPMNDEVLLLPIRTGDAGQDVFTDLDPEYAAPPAPQPVGSTLERWTLDPSSRLWLLALGVFCILLGVLPSAGTQRAA